MAVVAVLFFSFLAWKLCLRHRFYPPKSDDEGEETADVKDGDGDKAGTTESV